MELLSYKASAPGSLMLFGEHAVLHGKLALVAAINKYMHVTLTPRKDRTINIIAPAVGTLKTSLKNLKPRSPFTFVLAAIEHEKAHLPCGFDLFIESDFSMSLGLGSSAAVTVATLGALKCWLSKSKSNQLTKTDLLHLLIAARHIIRETQGLGSGADVAASIFGGIVQYRAQPMLVKKIALALPFAVIYSGRKVPTVKVVEQVEKRRAKNKILFADIDCALEQCVKDAIIAIKNKRWEHLGEIANIHQGLQDALGVNNLELATIIFSLRNTKGIYGAKISGSGLGDCAIGIGDQRAMPRIAAKKVEIMMQKINVNVSTTGLVLQTYN